VKSEEIEDVMAILSEMGITVIESGGQTDHDLGDSATQANLRETSERVLAGLTPREQRVLRMRFGIGMNTGHSLDEVGRQFEITRERIRAIEAKALKKLRTQKELSKSPAPKKVPTLKFVKSDMIPRPSGNPANDNDGK